MIEFQVFSFFLLFKTRDPNLIVHFDWIIGAQTHWYTLTRRLNERVLISSCFGRSMMESFSPVDVTYPTENAATNSAIFFHHFRRSKNTTWKWHWFARKKSIKKERKKEFWYWEHRDGSVLHVSQCSSSPRHQINNSLFFKSSYSSASAWVSTQPN